MSASPVHAHAIFDLVGAQAGGIAVDDLRTLAEEKFGNALFRNCEGRQFAFDQFIAFARERNKLIERDGKLSLVQSNICNGEHEH